MLEYLKEEVFEANIALQKYKLVTFTWGNISGIDSQRGIIAIKPSGVPYEDLQPDDIVLLDTEGTIVEGKLKPSSDTKTHIVLYKNFPEIRGIAHTHSTYATAWAQSGRDLPCYGTTHADYFRGSVPCSIGLTPTDLENYEYNTGVKICEEFNDRGIDYRAVPAVLSKAHGPFTWGDSPFKALYHSVVLEKCAKMAIITELINKDSHPIDQYLQDKHYYRKHGANAYYGQ